mgnify:CR=1 FL=1
MRRRLGDWLVAYAFIAPAVILFLLLGAFTVFYGLRLSFVQWNGINPEWTEVGLKNYADILWGNPATQSAVTPTIPTFSGETGWGGIMTPGGFKSFEHLWAMRHAFELHEQIGKPVIRDRIHELNRQAREGLAQMQHVRLLTPLDPELAAGIVSFDVQGMSAQAVVDRLAEHNIVASVTPYDVPYARLSPGLLNSTAEIDETLAVIRDMA